MELTRRVLLAAGGGVTVASSYSLAGEPRAMMGGSVGGYGEEEYGVGSYGGTREADESTDDGGRPVADDGEDVDDGETNDDESEGSDDGGNGSADDSGGGLGGFPPVGDETGEDVGDDSAAPEQPETDGDDATDTGEATPDDEIDGSSTDVVNSTTGEIVESGDTVAGRDGARASDDGDGGQATTNSSTETPPDDGTVGDDGRSQTDETADSSAREIADGSPGFGTGVTAVGVASAFAVLERLHRSSSEKADGNE